MIGHNGIPASQLKSLIERIERLEEEKAGIGEGIREVFQEARSQGFDQKAMRAVLRERKMSAEDRRTQEELLDLYRHALGMLDGTPLGEAAMQAVENA
jgi:uncharacterized protein (UPF0335 family)